MDAWGKLGPRAGKRDLEAFIARFPGSSLLAAAQSRIDATESAIRQEQLVREFEDKERRLRARLDEFEAGYRRATEELAQLRSRDSSGPVDPGSRTGPAATSPAPGSVAAPPPVAAATAASKEQRQADKEKAERLASIIATLDADKAKIAAERAELEKAMRESIARAQARREQAEQRVEAEVARLPPAAALAAPAPVARPRAVTCRELTARAQLGELSDGDRDILRNQCR